MQTNQGYLFTATGYEPVHRLALHHTSLTQHYISVGVHSFIHTITISMIDDGGYMIGNEFDDEDIAPEEETVIREKDNIEYAKPININKNLTEKKKEK
ncbi:MAG: hypothetical protein LGB68_07095 [Sulfurovum sp.]|nr:hypothetical protein [Sulfurovum sp.]